MPPTSEPAFPVPPQPQPPPAYPQPDHTMANMSLYFPWEEEEEEGPPGDDRAPSIPVPAPVSASYVPPPSRYPPDPRPSLRATRIPSKTTAKTKETVRHPSGESVVRRPVDPRLCHLLESRDPLRPPRAPLPASSSSSSPPSRPINHEQNETHPLELQTTAHHPVHPVKNSLKFIEEQIQTVLTDMHQNQRRMQDVYAATGNRNGNGGQGEVDWDLPIPRELKTLVARQASRALNEPLTVTDDAHGPIHPQLTPPSTSTTDIQSQPIPTTKPRAKKALSKDWKEKHRHQMDYAPRMEDVAFEWACVLPGAGMDGFDAGTSAAGGGITGIGGGGGAASTPMQVHSLLASQESMSMGPAAQILRPTSLWLSNDETRWMDMLRRPLL